MYKTLTALVLGMVLAACGGPGANDASGGGGGESGAKDLSGIGTTPNFAADHPTYLTGKHQALGCDSCHTLPLTGRAADGAVASAAATAERQAICAACHQARYDATTLLKHADHKIGRYCNSCHYSDSFTTRNRVAHSAYHDQITTGCDTCHVNRAPSWHKDAGLKNKCEDCHAYPAFKPVTKNKHSRITGNCEACHSGRQPSTHTAARQTGCVRCHSYPSWTNTTGVDHTGITGGCNASGCHSRHYDNYDCVWCHTSADPGNAWNGYRHNKVDSRACTACHKGGKGDRNNGLLTGWFD
ncbi:MAG: hypothetical protein HQK87_10590 [Nitrospinae bacterium]|nr:hypothetical protein [Nitrospinota bacterium]